MPHDEGAAGIDARTADVFCPQVLSEIAEYVQQPGRSVILCDGGDKPAELRQIAQIAKPGDLILAHDSASDRDYFRREMLGKRPAGKQSERRTDAVGRWRRCTGNSRSRDPTCQ